MLKNAQLKKICIRVCRPGLSTNFRLSLSADVSPLELDPKDSYTHGKTGPSYRWSRVTLSLCPLFQSLYSFTDQVGVYVGLQKCFDWILTIRPNINLLISHRPVHQEYCEIINYQDLCLENRSKICQCQTIPEVSPGPAYITSSLLLLVVFCVSISSSLFWKYMF